MAKKLILVLITIMGLSLLCSTVSFAQNKPSDSIFEHKKELLLTDDQEKDLHEIITKLQGYLTDRTKELEGLRADLNKMIADKAELYKIKAKLRAMGQIQADSSYEDIASSRAIEKELTATQLSQWHSLQEEFRKSMPQAQDNAVAKQKGVAQ